MEEKTLKLIKILNQKNQKLKEIFEYTNSKNFDINIKEVENIELYIKKRTRLFDEINFIETDLKQLNIKINNLKNQDIINLNKENNELIKKIIDLDKKNQTIFSKITLNLKNTIKNIKKSGEINKNYFSVYQIGSVGSNFDSLS